jgi:hypothetical protein
MSMVNLAAPDLNRYPRFTDALAAAECAELEPGDDGFIPNLWWHNVESLDPFNLLVNYGGTTVSEAQGRHLPRSSTDYCRSRIYRRIEGMRGAAFSITMYFRKMENRLRIWPRSTVGCWGACPPAGQ